MLDKETSDHLSWSLLILMSLLTYAESKTSDVNRSRRTSFGSFVHKTRITVSLIDQLFILFFTIKPKTLDPIFYFLTYPYNTPSKIIISMFRDFFLNTIFFPHNFFGWRDCFASDWLIDSQSWVKVRIRRFQIRETFELENDVDIFVTHTL